MKYNGVKVLEINPAVYLGDEFKNNDWRKNQDIFKNKIDGVAFEVGFSFECPIEDLICIQIDYTDDFEPLAKADTIDDIFSVTRDLLGIFETGVKINLYLDGFLEDGGNSVDMSVPEFTEWLRSELNGN